MDKSTDTAIGHILSHKASLVCFALACGLVLLSSLFKLSLEDSQLFAFPVLLVGFFLFDKDSWLRPPTILLVLAFLLWGLSGLKLRGYIGEIGDTIPLAILTDDSSGEQTKKFRVAYRWISRNYDLPSLSPLKKSFSSADEAREWQKSSRSDRPMLFGDPSWLGLSLPARPLEKIAGLKVAEASESGELLNNYNITESDQFVEVSDIDSGFKYLLSPGVDILKIPTTESNLGQFYIAWMAKAFLSSGADGNLNSETISSLSKAAELSGPWKSVLPPSYAHFLLGSSYILSAINQNLIAELECGVESLKESAAFHTKRESLEHYAALLNNASVGQALFSKDEGLLRQARAWAWKASNIRDESGEPVRSAKLAYFNLIQMERGFIVPR